MVALVDTRAGAACDDALRGMFAARKQVFVDLLGWDVPVLDGRFEIDQFDNEHARYLILVDAKGHLGSARLLPTTREHILDGLFPSLCAEPVPKGPAIYEITRFCLDRRLTAQERREIRNRLVTALVLHAFAEGIDTYTGVAEPDWLNQILRFGWEAVALGQPIAIGNQMLGAVGIHVTEQTPQLLEATGIWLPTPQAHEAPTFVTDK